MSTSGRESEETNPGNPSGHSELGEDLLPTQTMSSGQLWPSKPVEAGILGPYHLLRPIDRGGMGEVCLAEQKQPIHRHVAVKLIKAGMNTSEVVARFESERQALALLDHPSIAKVFDACSTS